jgi:hypothetical protein
MQDASISVAFGHKKLHVANWITNCHNITGFVPKNISASS